MNELDSARPKQTRKVGYCKPPAHSQFKPGQSGNRKGRPKGSQNLGTVLARILREKVIINENGKRKSVSKLEAAVTQVTNKAASGDLKAVALLAGLVRSAEERAVEGVDSAPLLREEDEKVVIGILKRLEIPGKENSENGSETGGD